MLRLLPNPPAEADAAPDGRGVTEGGLSSHPRALDPLSHVATLARAGNAGAQRTLLIAVGPALLKVVRGVLGATHPEVEDTLQESMVALHLALPGFRGECTTLHFACRIAVQTAMNAKRRAGYRARLTPSAEPSELDGFPCDEGSPAEIIASERRRDALRRLLAELPDAQAEALALHTILGYTIEETAEATAAPVNTARSRLRNALSKLRARVLSD